MILMTIHGMLLTVGLFVHPVMEDKGLIIGESSIALAIGQNIWGLFQPLFRTEVDKGYAFTALCVGALAFPAKKSFKFDIFLLSKQKIAFMDMTPKPNEGICVFPSLQKSSLLPFSELSLLLSPLWGQQPF